MSTGHAQLPPVEGKKLQIRPRYYTPWGEIFRNMTGENRQRSLLGFILMVGQAFYFNAVFFTFGLVVKKFFQVSDETLPLQTALMLAVAIAEFFIGVEAAGKSLPAVSSRCKAAAEPQ